MLLCAEAVLAGRQWIDRTVMEQVARRAIHGDPPAPDLTARERDVALLVGQGYRNKEIGLALAIGEGTVKMHLHNLYQKLGFASRTELALMVRDWPAERR